MSRFVKFAKIDTKNYNIIYWFDMRWHSLRFGRYTDGNVFSWWSEFQIHDSLFAAFGAAVIFFLFFFLVFSVCKLKRNTRIRQDITYSLQTIIVNKRGIYMDNTRGSEFCLVNFICRLYLSFLMSKTKRPFNTFESIFAWSGK